MTLRYYVRTVRHDGSVVLSRPFSEQAEGDRWARIARRDANNVVQALVIVRPVDPIRSEPTDRPTAA